LWNVYKLLDVIELSYTNAKNAKHYCL